MRPLRFLLLLAALGLVAGCGSSADDEKPAEKTSTPGPASTPTVEATGCAKVDAPKGKGAGDLRKPTTKLDPEKSYTAVVKTSCGEFEIALDVERAPKTTASFAYLVRQKFFDRTTFHRIIPGFVIQGGDPEGTGLGGPGYTVVEPPPKNLSYRRGIVAMAKAETEPPGASGSQFYVVTGEDAGLPPDYALLGKVSKGQDVVDAIGTTPTNPADDRPIDPVVIDSVTIREG